jgi:hypothetical protein
MCADPLHHKQQTRTNNTENTMNANIIRRLEMFIRVSKFGTESGLTFTTRGTVLFGEINQSIASLQALGGDQFEGGGHTRSGTAERRAKAAETMEELKAIARTARALDPEQFPGVAESLRLPRSRSYQAVRSAAAAAIALVTPIKSAFVDREMPADFDVQLTTLLAEFDTATGRKYAGLQGQATGTNTMKVIAANGMRDVKELKAIVSNQLRKTNPGLLAAWNNASRLQRAPQSPEPTVPPAPAPTA